MLICYLSLGPIMKQFNYANAYETLETLAGNTALLSSLDRREAPWFQIMKFVSCRRAGDTGSLGLLAYEVMIKVVELGA